MLQKIRDRISGWVAGAVIALVAGAFIFWSVEFYFGAGVGKKSSVVTVNGVAITHQQLNDYFTTLQRNLIAKNNGQPLPEMLQQELKSYALQTLITQTALLTTLEKENFGISMTQIKMMVERASQFQENGQFSEEKLLQALYTTGTSPAQFFQQLQSQWIVSQAMNGVTASNFVLPNEINHWTALLNQQRAFGYTLIPVQRFLTKATVTDQAVKQFYTDNAAQFETPAQVRVSYLLLSPTQIGKTITVTDDEAKQYYDSNPQNYQVPARWKITEMTIPVAKNASAADIQKAEKTANAISAAITKGESFEKAIAANKQMTHTTQTVSAAELGASLQSILSTLPVGKVSKPMRMQNGFTLLKILQHDPAKVHSFQEVKASIVEMLKHQKINQVFSKQSSVLSDLAYTSPDSLDAASKALHLPIQESGMLTKAGEKTGLFSNPKILAAVFSDSVYQSGNNSDPIGMSNGDQVVLRVKNKIPSKPVAFDQVSAKIKEKLKVEQASKLAGLLAYQVQQQINKGANPETVATSHALPWHKQPLMRDNTKTTVPAAIVTQAFSMPRGVKAFLSDPSNYAVVSVTDIDHKTTGQISTEKKQAVQKQLDTLWTGLLQHCFVGSVMRQSVVNRP
ncbi:MAG: hypothetical protein A3I77_07785 [Gammaproteobacteria bacterium RIFCSPLOWO2_02_FULL_42_14]|nr:MAG: hypothetical protein A3B71_03615 [Gammaproteobacteria bacterium RIFCSPHIGHO2_02_FULL_42_43]OGT28867.1 MAG: hypothetical protein A2624_06575 [Gammaproteobacteria bacterium RIFCSPHIGHO2_01_FULL_42_8]OGT52985.1 MAG: hypothetical protein A3E54_07910 [Gammaproteobacteria bacterium RIFCSPHIGHO2_12_FULL_41_25]OGT61243.1 MAG: hypothetical protein A3I77_07785 [Gammaproteobacteria bacterium RIFCSPLOWO2_02_FULL_42_14]OGT87170.1 MAG: hypothetical protein A3G86_01505 [Gammaproteobacteria bacterium R